MCNLAFMCSLINLEFLSVLEIYLQALFSLFLFNTEVNLVHNKNKYGVTHHEPHILIAYM